MTQVRAFIWAPRSALGSAQSRAFFFLLICAFFCSPSSRGDEVSEARLKQAEAFKRFYERVREIGNPTPQQIESIRKETVEPAQNEYYRVKNKWMSTVIQKQNAQSQPIPKGFSAPDTVGPFKREFPKQFREAEKEREKILKEKSSSPSKAAKTQKGKASSEKDEKGKKDAPAEVEEKKEIVLDGENIPQEVDFRKKEDPNEKSFQKAQENSLEPAKVNEIEFSGSKP